MASSNVKEKKPGIVKYFKSVRSEVKKVTWPSRKDVWQYTLVVLAMCFISAAVIGLYDLIFKYLFDTFA